MITKQIYNVVKDLYIPGPEVIPNTTEILPPINLLVKHNPVLGFHFQHMEDFDIPEKIYGDVEEKAERIIRTYQSREGSTGVLLEGEKGSGKTMLAKLICKIANNLDMPTLVVSDNFSSTEFNQFIQSIKQPKVILFDEFEKTFAGDIRQDESMSYNDQENLLTLLDGTMTNKTLYLFTCNDIHLISSKLTNRPGRIFYHITYTGLDDKFIEGYCMDNLKDMTFFEDFKTITLLYDAFNFDILKALVEESNRYNESPLKFLDIINARPTSYNTIFNVEIFDKDDFQLEFYPKTRQLDIRHFPAYLGFAESEEQYNDRSFREKLISRPDFAKNKLFFPFNENTFTISGGKITAVNEHGYRAVFVKSTSKKRFAFNDVA